MEDIQGLIIIVGSMIALGVGIGIAVRVGVFIFYLGKD